MLTRHGWLVAGGGACALVAARLFGLAELYVVGAVALGLVAVALLHVRLSRLELDVDRRVVPTRIHVGQAGRVDVRLRNLRRAPTRVLRLSDPVSGSRGAGLLVPPLDGRAATVASYRLPTERRGLLRVGPLRVTITDPFGLAHVGVVAAPRVEITVLPVVDRIHPAPRTSAPDPTASVRRPRAVGRTGEDFYALRPYTVGDDLRRIHWRSTARHDELLVRQQEQPWQGRATVLLDVRRAAHDHVSLERAVSAAASVLSANGNRNDVVRLLTTSGFDSGFSAGTAHLAALVERLALVGTSGSASLRTSVDVLRRTGGNGGALVVVLGQTTAEELTEIGRLRRQFGWVAVVVVDGTVARDPFPAPAGLHVVPITSRTPLPTAWDRAVRVGSPHALTGAARR